MTEERNGLIFDFMVEVFLVWFLRRELGDFYCQ